MVVHTRSLSMMKAFSKKSMLKVLREIHASSFFRSGSYISPVNVTPTEPYIHRLPVELLEQIFLLVINDTPDYPSIFSCGRDTISVNVASPPLVLTRVCRLWRVVAHSTAALWSRVQVALPGRILPLNSFLPNLLKCWLARSGNLPLTLRIVAVGTGIGKPQSCHHLTCPDYCPWISSGANFRLLDILFDERKRWETLVMPARMYDWRFCFGTPQLRTLECHLSNLNAFNTPNLSRLYINSHCHWISQMKLSISFSKDLRHLRLLAASAYAICTAIAIYPHLEAIVVDDIVSHDDLGAEIDSATLKSVTLPLPSSLSGHFRQEFIEVFSQLHLPMLRKLTLVGTPKKQQVNCLLVALAVASFQVPVVDFQMDTPLRKAHMNNIEPLLSVVGEVTFCGKPLQINEHRNSRRMRKLKLRFSR
ncbi:hypothetical protein EDB19DRAFT_106070 [Suillus lakei]|nr:hypothetical protein EDB19DRAFT_106070 [Suillus lakei]